MTIVNELGWGKARCSRTHYCIPAAVTAGIWDCIKLYTEKPPKGSTNNLGLPRLPALGRSADQTQATAELGQSALAWRDLGCLLLPDAVAPFHETRQLIERKRQLFTEQGGASLAERQAINARLQAIRATMNTDFPLDATAVVALCTQLSEQILHIRDLEQAAITQLRAIMV